jgi:hypothetical protein
MSYWKIFGFAVVQEILSAVGVGDFTIKVNHR